MSVYPQGSTFRDSDKCPDSGNFFDVPPGGWTPRRRRPKAEGRPTSGGPLVTSRNNCHPPLVEEKDQAVWEPLRGYITACGKGTLALYYSGGRTVYGALMCGSWNCPSCRKRLAARQLDRLRRGMESRPDWHRTFITLTMDPVKFGAVVVGKRKQDDGRVTNLVSEPTRAQYLQAAEAMSKEWHALNRRLKAKAKRAGTVAGLYFRVVELHRNGWPHYHVAFEHPTWTADDIRQQVEGWGLGRVDLRSITLDDAVGELAPYLVSSERKSGGSKAYQFAAAALPKGFRLVSSSRGFFLDEDTETERPEHHLVLKGHFSTYHTSLSELGADARLMLHAPTDGEHRPPSRTVATGDAAVVYFAELTQARTLHLDHVRDSAAALLGPADGASQEAGPEPSGPRRAKAPLQGAAATPN